VIWLLAWLSFFATSVQAQLPEAVATCEIDGIESCKDARFQLGKITNDQFAKMFEMRRPKFIEWIKPVALYIQGVSGLPASVFMAQAAVSSDWGASPAFRNNNNIFKHMCWVPNSTITGEFEFGGRKFAYKGNCGVEKTFGSVARLLRFPSREDSILAYLHILLLSPSKQFKAVHEELKRGVNILPARLAGFRTVAAGLSAFSPDAKYVSDVVGAISDEKLAGYDVPTCWRCLLNKQGEKSP
jgi:hypothetical protein